MSPFHHTFPKGTPKYSRGILNGNFDNLHSLFFFSSITAPTTPKPSCGKFVYLAATYITFEEHLNGFLFYSKFLTTPPPPPNKLNSLVLIAYQWLAPTLKSKVPSGQEALRSRSDQDGWLVAQQLWWSYLTSVCILVKWDDFVRGLRGGVSAMINMKREGYR